RRREAPGGALHPRRDRADDGHGDRLARRGSIASARPRAAGANRRPWLLATGGDTVMDLAPWLGFLGLSILAVLTPGPTLLAGVGHAAGSGFRRTVPVVLGNALGIASVIAVSIAGLGGALLRAPAVLAALQLGGASYLAWHGLRTWWNRAAPLPPATERAGV